MDQNETLPIIIRKYREQKGYTQEELSQAIHKLDKYIGAVECGRVTPPFPVLTEIVRILEIDGNVLFYGSVNKEISRAADFYLRKMDPTTQNLALDIMRTMANHKPIRDKSKGK